MTAPAPSLAVSGAGGTAGGTSEGIAMLEAIFTERRSTRGFLRDPIPRDELTRMFEAAQRAPSWCNIQPWRVVLTDPPLTAELGLAMQAAARTGQPTPEVPWPGDYPEPYKERRFDCGSALYAAMGVSRSDTEARYDAFMRNYAFFGAPHVAIVSCDGRLGPYPYVDVGVWLGYLLTAATAMGIATCALASIGAYPGPLRERLPIPATDVILFGIAFGREDSTVPANRCRTAREPLASNLIFFP